MTQDTRGSLYVVATPIGNLNDITPRALETLRSVSLVLAEDTRRSKRLLQHYGIDVPTLSFHRFNERDRAEEVLRRILSEGISVAVVSDAGTPCISDPGVEIVRRARDAGVPVLAVSGPSAISAAISVSGLPSREFTFLGFLPRARGELGAALRSLRDRRISTFVAYESPKRIRALAAAILEELPQAKVCFLCELTKLHERSYYGPIGDVKKQLDADPMVERGEYTVVVHVDQRGPNDLETPRLGESAETADATTVSGHVPAAKPVSPEALLVQAMLEHECSLKEAGAIVARETGLPKKEVYQARLRLKTLLSKRDGRRPS